MKSPFTLFLGSLYWRGLEFGRQFLFVIMKAYMRGAYMQDFTVYQMNKINFLASTPYTLIEGVGTSWKSECLFKKELNVGGT